MMYRKCVECGKKVPIGELCICEKEKKKRRYRNYKKRRMQDPREKERQNFYCNDAWLNLSENIKKHYLGMCVVCWHNELIEENEFTHHIETIKDRFDLRLCKDNLIPLCDYCHKKVHRTMEKSYKDKITVQKELKCLIKKFNEEFY